MPCDTACKRPCLSSYSVDGLCCDTASQGCNRPAPLRCHYGSDCEGGERVKCGVVHVCLSRSHERLPARNYLPNRSYLGKREVEASKITRIDFTRTGGRGKKRCSAPINSPFPPQSILRVYVLRLWARYIT